MHVRLPEVEISSGEPSAEGEAEACQRCAHSLEDRMTAACDIMSVLLPGASQAKADDALKAGIARRAAKAAALQQLPPAFIILRVNCQS